MEYSDKLNSSPKHKEEVDKVFKNLKKRKPKDLDATFHDAHNKVFNEVDCLKCANCCKTTSPIFRDIDIQRISKKLKMNTSDFEKEFLRKDEDNDWVLQSSPCFFLGSDNKCFIYDVRPQACREYPHTDRKRMFQILDLTKKNMDICPGVAMIVDEVVGNYR